MEFESYIPSRRSITLHTNSCQSFDIPSDLFIWPTKTDDKATEFTSAVVQAILTMLNCRLKVISPYNNGSSSICKKQIKTISEIIVKHLWDKGQMWPLFSTTAAYAMNIFASEALSGFSPFQLVF